MGQGCAQLRQHEDQVLAYPSELWQPVILMARRKSWIELATHEAQCVFYLGILRK